MTRAATEELLLVQTPIKPILCWTPHLWRAALLATHHAGWTVLLQHWRLENHFGTQDANSGERRCNRHSALRGARICHPRPQSAAGGRAGKARSQATGLIRGLSEQLLCCGTTRCTPRAEHPPWDARPVSDPPKAPVQARPETRGTTRRRCCRCWSARAPPTSPAAAALAPPRRAPTGAK